MPSIRAMLTFPSILCALPFSLQHLVGQVPLIEIEHVASPFTPAIDSYINDVLDEFHTPGMAIGIIQGNQTWLKGYGYASLETKEPVTPHTLFLVGSTTKSFTASAAALLVQDNDTYDHIDWTTPISEIARDDFVLRDPYLTSQITIEDALSHRTGYSRHDTLWINQELNAEGITRRLRYLPPSTPLRTVWEYCNIMFVAVARAIEVVTSMSLEQIFHDWLFEPLQMHETFLGVESAKRCAETNKACKLAQFYDWDNSTSSSVRLSKDTIPESNGAGGIISNVHDYVLWVRALMTATGPVSSEGHKALRTPRMVAEAGKIEGSSDGPTLYNLGLTSSTYRQTPLIGHNGNIGTYNALMTFLPEKDWGIVMFQNGPLNSQYAIYHRFLDDFLETPKPERKDWIASAHNDDRKANAKMLARPAKLYPDVPKVPIPHALKLNDYAGKYTHPAYGTLTVELHELGKDFLNPLRQDDVAALTPVIRIKGLNIELDFHHVSGEHWLVEEHYCIRKEVPTGYFQGRFEVGANGKVTSLYMVIGLPWDDSWSTFAKVD